MPFQIIRNDITRVKADAIVNTANPKPFIGSGTDSAIYEAAGRDDLLAERKRIGDIAPGAAVYTSAFGLSAKYIIHTVGPVWVDGSHGEREILHSCYNKSLSLAAELKCRSIAFPLIASGAYGFPKDEALNIAMAEIGKFLLTHEMKITLVVFGRRALALSEKLMGSVKQYIDDHAVGHLKVKEYGSTPQNNRRRRELEQLENLVRYDIATDSEPLGISTGSTPHFEEEPQDTFSTADSLDDYLRRSEKSFQEQLFELIKEKQLSDVTVYKKANISRKVFSSIRCKPDYKPKKKTAVAFGIALELDMPAMSDLLARAGFALSPSYTFDLIISYFISEKLYDVDQINLVLFEYGQPLLGY